MGNFELARLAEGGEPARRLNAARGALLKHKPDKAHAMRQTELFKVAGIITKATAQRALKQLLETTRIQRIEDSPYRYFA